MKLTKAQWNFLAEARKWTTRGGTDGVGAWGSRYAMASKLEGLGLVVYVGTGQCENSRGDAERPIFAITARGREALQSESTDAATHNEGSETK